MDPVPDPVHDMIVNPLATEEGSFGAIDKEADGADKHVVANGSKTLFRILSRPGTVASGFWKKMSELDKNGDGTIDMDELQEFMRGEQAVRRRSQVLVKTLVIVTIFSILLVGLLAGVFTVLLDQGLARYQQTEVSVDGMLKNAHNSSVDIFTRNPTTERFNVTSDRRPRFTSPSGQTLSTAPTTAERNGVRSLVDDTGSVVTTRVSEYVTPVSALNLSAVGEM
eukprot:7067191-Pyramimonas_sp.AAC.1